MGLLVATTMAMTGCGGKDNQTAAADGGDKKPEKKKGTIWII